MAVPSTLETLFHSLRTRGCIADTTANIVPGIAKALSASSSSSSLPPASVYAGFDPTGPSLHLGHASVLLMLKRCQLIGLKPIALIGGATALIGDPSGKREDRPLLSEENVYQNSIGIRNSIQEILELEEKAIPEFSSSASSVSRKGILVNNADFYRDMSILTFLRTIGRYARVSTMLNKDSVRSRLQSSPPLPLPPPSTDTPNTTSSTSGGGNEPTGLSFTEFSYQLFQAADYAKLYQLHNCILQVGGSDQWGNITAGIDLIKRSIGSVSSSSSMDTHHIHGLTVPLLTTADGKKFGKTEGAPIWLDSKLTSHHNFYQYLLRVEDKDVEQLLNRLTLLSDEEIQNLLKEHSRQPELKRAQVVLADTVTTMFRSKQAMESAHRSARILYAGTSLWSTPNSSTTTLTSTNSIDKNGSSSSHLYLPQRSLLPEIKVDDILSICSSSGTGILSTTDSTATTVTTPTAIPYIRLPSNQIHHQALIDTLVTIGAVTSKNQGRKLIESGGVYWNWERISTKEGSWSNKTKDTLASSSPGVRSIDIEKDFLEQRVAVVSVGKKKMYVIECI